MPCAELSGDVGTSKMNSMQAYFVLRAVIFPNLKGLLVSRKAWDGRQGSITLTLNALEQLASLAHIYRRDAVWYFPPGYNHTSTLNETLTLQRQYFKYTAKHAVPGNNLSPLSPKCTCPNITQFPKYGPFPTMPLFVYFVNNVWKDIWFVSPLAAAFNASLVLSVVADGDGLFDSLLAQSLEC